MKVIDATNCVLGRFASGIAKMAMKGEKISIINSEKAVILGKKQDIVRKYKQKIDLKVKGNPEKSPKYSRMPDKIVKQAIKGMLPTKKTTGRKALKLVWVFIKTPKKFKEKNIEELSSTKNNSMQSSITIEELSKQLGAKF